MPKEIGILKDSFARVFAAKATIAHHFYRHLFTTKPAFRPLFERDLQSHKEMFAGIIAHTMRALDSYPAYPDVFARIAEKHGDLNLDPDDFRLAEGALIEALRDSPNLHLTEAELDAWDRAIRWLVDGFVERCCHTHPPDAAPYRTSA